MNPKMPELIAYIVNEINKRGGQATKQKVLLLLYLFDVEYLSGASRDVDRLSMGI